MISLADWIRGEELKAAGMAQAERNDKRFIVAARQAVILVARRNENFTTDDLWPYITVAPKSKGSMGAIMNWAAKKKFCEDTGWTAKTLRARGHARKITIWKSLIRRVEENEQRRE